MAFANKAIDIESGEKLLTRDHLTLYKPRGFDHPVFALTNTCYSYIRIYIIKIEFCPVVTLTLKLQYTQLEVSVQKPRN